MAAVTLSATVRRIASTLEVGNGTRAGVVEKVETGDRAIVRGLGIGTAMNSASSPDDGVSVKMGLDVAGASVGIGRKIIRVRLSQIEKVVGRSIGGAY